MKKTLLTRAEFGLKYGLKPRKVSEIVKSGDLLTEFQGNKRLIVDCKFNDNTIRELIKATK